MGLGVQFWDLGLRSLGLHFQDFRCKVLLHRPSPRNNPMHAGTYIYIHTPSYTRSFTQLGCGGGLLGEVIAPRDLWVRNGSSDYIEIIFSNILTLDPSPGPKPVPTTTHTHQGGVYSVTVTTTMPHNSSQNTEALPTEALPIPQ